MIGLIVFFIGLIVIVTVCIIGGYLDNEKGMMTTKTQQIVWTILPILDCILLFIGLALMAMEI